MKHLLRLSLLVICVSLSFFVSPCLGQTVNNESFISYYNRHYHFDKIQNCQLQSLIIKRVIADAKREKDVLLEAFASCKLAELNMLEMKYDTAFSVTNIALNMIQKKDAPELKAQLLLCRAKIQALRSNYEDGMNDAHQLLKMAEQYKLYSMKARALLVIARIDVISYRDAMAEKHANESRRVAEQYGLSQDRNKAIVMLARISSLADCTATSGNRNDEAMKLALLAYRTARQQKDTLSVIESASIIADIYCSMNRWTKKIIVSYQAAAKQYLDEALNDALLIKSPYYMVQSYRYLIRWYRVNKDYQKALECCQTIVRQVDSNNYQVLSNAYDQMVALYTALGNLDKALESHERYVEYIGKQSNFQLQQALQEQETKYETQQKEARIKTQGFLLTVLVIILILCIASIYVINRYRILTRRRNSELKIINDGKDKFFNIISHDLKNPAIEQRNALQVLSTHGRELDSDTLEQYHTELLKSANAEVNLLHNLLNWAKIETGKITYQPIRVDVTSLLQEEANRVKTMAQHKQVELAINIPAQFTTVADPNLISTIVRNLLTNAIKFTTQGGRVSLDVVPKDKGFSVSVADTGVGMSEEQIQNIFRIDKYHSTPGTAGEKGSGLGLIICRELLEKHGSRLQVESAVGIGTKFYFEIHN